MENYKQESTGLTLEVPPFVLGTKKGHVLLLHAAIFEEQPGSLQHKGERMMDFVPKLVKSVSAHPQLPQFAIINADGSFQVHDYNTRGLCSQREFFKLRAEAIAYSPSGLVIACGFFNGFLKIIDSDTLQDMENIAISRSAITKLEFASNETLLAVVDASFAVSLVSCSITKNHLEDKWEYVGKFRSHARTITGLHFTKDEDGNNRLFSVGHDCMIVEYDLLESVNEKRLKLRGTWPLNAVALPMALFSTTGFVNGKLHLLISDSTYKVRVYDTNNFACHKTFLGPTFGTPVNNMFRVSSEQSSQGENFPNERVLDATLDVDQLHKLLSALGVFPSSHEIQEILTEINETFPSKRSISFNDFLLIFLNHRPVMGLNASVFQQAFSALGADIGSGQLNLEHLLTMLQNEGERMTREEIEQCFETVLDNYTHLDTLPTDIDATWFADKVMKL